METDEVRIVAVEDRTAATLLSWIEIFVHTDLENPTRIVTDGWPSYNNLPNLGFIHEVDIHENGIFG